MSRNPYAPAVHAVLKPHGFAKIPGLEWRREADGYLDQIHLQSCGLDRTVTVNIFIRDLATKGLLERITAGIQGGLYYSVRRRIRSFVSVYDKWWARDDPEGPQEVAQLLRDHALPFLDSMHSDEAMISEMRRIIAKDEPDDEGQTYEVRVDPRHKAAFSQRFSGRIEPA